MKDKSSSKETRRREKSRRSKKKSRWRRKSNERSKKNKKRQNSWQKLSKSRQSRRRRNKEGKRRSKRRRRLMVSASLTGLKSKMMLMSHPLSKKRLRRISLINAQGMNSLNWKTLSP